jgi:1,4-dihydroxy-2-naphthoate octaprenyltransferase
MRTAIIICSVLCLISGCSLILASLHEQALTALIFLALGLAAIAAALKYTIGRSAYGYNGLGDVFVLLFFGLVGVGGSFYLQAHTLDYLVLLPGLTIGCFATGVLNLNNMRDRISDAKAGKNTIVVMMGAHNARHISYTADIDRMGSSDRVRLSEISLIHSLPVCAYRTIILEKYLRSMEGRRPKGL